MSLLSPPAPALTMTRDAAVCGGSYGPVIAALVIIAVLTVASVAIGQLCVGRRLFVSSIKCGAHGIGAFMTRRKRGGDGGAAYDVDLPVKKKGGDIESGAAVEEVERSEAPKVEEDDDGAASRASF